jgi:hypothetical protein
MLCTLQLIICLVVTCGGFLKSYALKTFQRTKSVNSFHSLRSNLRDLPYIEIDSSGTKKSLRWDESSQSFVLPKQPFSYRQLFDRNIVIGSLKNCFLPSGLVSPDYYNYILWRSLQRFISSTCNVLGTQALLLALGFKKQKIGQHGSNTFRIIYIFLNIY